MKINDLEFKIKAYQPIFDTKWNLIRTASGTYKVSDRGLPYDKYSTTVTFYGRKDDVFFANQTFYSFRNSQTELVLSELPDNIFGDHIVHDDNMICLLENIGEVTSPMKNVFQFEATLLLTNITYKPGIGSLPLSLNCLRNIYKAYNSFNIEVQRNYISHNQFNDYLVDTFMFRGQYYMSRDDLSEFLLLYVNQRGNYININETQFGVTKMFGPNISSTTHTVIITNIEVDYSDTDSGKRLVTIELKRDGKQ